MLYYSKKKKKHIVYPNLQSAMCPVEQSENLPVPKRPDQEMQSSSSSEENFSGEYLEPSDPESENKPIPFSQEALNDLYKDLYLTLLHPWDTGVPIESLECFIFCTYFDL